MFNSNTWETEAGGLKVPGQSKQYNETLLQKQTLPKQKKDRQRLVAFLHGQLGYLLAIWDIFSSSTHFYFCGSLRQMYVLIWDV